MNNNDLNFNTQNSFDTQNQPQDNNNMPNQPQDNFNMTNQSQDNFNMQSQPQDNNNMPNQLQNNNTNMNYASNGNNSGKKNNKIIFIVAGVVIVAIVVILLLLFKGSSKSGKNTTGSSEYKASDVAFSCSYVSEGENAISTTYTDFIFNYKSSQYTYQLKQYYKMVIEYKKTLTDEMYKEFIKELNSIDCLDAGSCTESHLELSITDFGWDTVVDRKGNTIEVTFNNTYGMGSTASKDDIKETKANFESEGYTCK